jgi:hypothetical protein
VPWIGHPCQKQPCTSTTSRASGKTKSGRITRPLSRTGRCRRQPVTPWRRRALASDTSVERLPLGLTLAITSERFPTVQMSKASPPKTRSSLADRAPRHPGPCRDGRVPTAPVLARNALGD